MAKIKWSQTATSRKNRFDKALDQAEIDAWGSVKLGLASTMLRQHQTQNFLKFGKGVLKTLGRASENAYKNLKRLSENKDYLYDQGATDSSLVIGPIRFAHSVQKINITEHKSVLAPKLLRSDRPMLVDGGTGIQKAVIQFMFSDLEEINTFLRGLVALFKVCPVISIENEMLSAAWAPSKVPLKKLAKEKIKRRELELADKDINKLYQDLKTSIKNGTFTNDYLSTIDTKFGNSTKLGDTAREVANELLSFQKNSRYVPVAMDSLSVQTVPDLPGILSATLTITRIDVSSCTESGYLEYLGPIGNQEANPRRAYWLKQYLKSLLSRDTAIAPVITDKDFSTVEIAFWNKTITDILPLEDLPEPNPLVLNASDDTSKVEGQSATIVNHFGYQRFIGKPVPCAQHMGTSARQITLDVRFSDDDEKFKTFNQFKDVSDNLAHSEIPYDRVMGWEVRAVAPLILGGSSADLQETRYGVYSPLVVDAETSDVPHLKFSSITFSETNTNLTEAHEVILEEGGTDFDDLKEFFIGKSYPGGRFSLPGTVGLVTGDAQFRKLDPAKRTEANLQGDWRASAHRVFWPLTNGIHFTGLSTGLHGIVNRDSLRAALFSEKFDKGGQLRDAMRQIIFFSGRVQLTKSPNLLDRFDLAWNSIGFWTPGIDSNRIRGAADELIQAVDRMFEGRPLLTNLSNAFRSGDVISAQSIIRKASRAERNRLRIVNVMLSSLAGRPQDLGGLILELAAGEEEFSRDFKEALFDVLVRRPKHPHGLPHVYDQSGLYAAFSALYLEYKLHREEYPGFRPTDNQTRVKQPMPKRTTYRDFAYLPTYLSLFGDNWEAFAPTFDDLGLTNPADYVSPSIMNMKSITARQQQIAVTADDIVPPHIWFYKNRRKADIREQYQSSSTSNSSPLDMLDTRHLSMNLSRRSDMKKIEAMQHVVSRLESLAKDPNYSKTARNNRETVDTMVGIIRRSYKDVDGQFDIDAFRKDLDRTRDLVNAPGKDPKENDQDLARRGAYQVFSKFFDPESPHYISLYMSTTASAQGQLAGHVFSKYQPSPAFGAALVRVMHNEQFRIQKESGFGTLGSHDEVLTTVGGPVSLGYSRNHRTNIDFTVKSSISQTTDMFDSPEAMWPTVKVYLIDRRGNDVVADDVMFSTDSIMSIKITKDKEDPDLAIIEIADPLRFMQDGEFFSRNLITQKGTKGSDSRTIVQGNKRAARESLLKAKKIEQGRPVMIKMGYDSSPENLKTVFTGRISEIELGDVVTLVCQGWKAELVNRQVNFYTSKKKNWGPKDLAVLAIQLANPDGFGQHLSESDANAILDSIDHLNMGNQLEHIMRVQEGTSNVYGVESFWSWLSNKDWIHNFFGVDDDRRYAGLDTRLKNIWYPDISKNINNSLNWRRLLGYPPDFSNDYWLVPIQPCWNVLKEASRHTWNYIVDTVPYDAESTIFFGHPDQTYFFTRGRRNQLASWRSIRSKVITTAMTLILESEVGDFLDNEARKYPEDQNLSAYFQGRGPLGVNTTPVDPSSDFLTSVRYNLSQARGNDVLAKLHRLTHNNGRVFKPSFSFVNRLHTRPDSPDQGGAWIARLAESKIMDSGLPSRALSSLKDLYGADITSTLLFVFFGFDPDSVKSIWHSHKSDMEALMGSHTISANKELFNQLTRRSDITLGDLSPATKRGELLTPEEVRQIRAEVVTPLRNIIDSRKVSYIAFKQNLWFSPRDRYRPPAPRDPVYVFPGVDRLYDLLGKMSEDTRLGKELAAYIKDLQSAVSEKQSTSRNLIRYISRDDAESLAKAKLSLDRVDSILSRIGIEYTRGDVGTQIGSVRPNARVPVVQGLPYSTTIGDIFKSYGFKFKAFVFFLDQYLKGKNVSEKVKHALADMEASDLAPNMQTFRVHHYVDSDKDIIANNIVASTADMWNTVVISRPAEDPSDLTRADSASEFHRGAQVQGATSWVYWPPSNVSKVIGLQFHPGLTISNKKLKVFTELNCVSEPLSAKIACNRMAEGMQRMYLGHLIIKGRPIKPYDRVVMNDKFTGMSGTIEVQSVVHMFTPETGWTCNIMPHAVCEANPGAAIVQTAIMEANYRAAMQTAEWIFFGINLMTIAFTGGTAAAGLKTAFKATGALRKTLLGRRSVAALARWSGRAVASKARALSTAAGSINPVHIATHLAKQYKLGTMAKRLLKSYLAEQTVRSYLHHVSQNAITTAWVRDNQDPKNLPVILSPLTFNGAPWTAGLEADDVLFAAPFYDSYYSIAAAITAMSDTFGTFFTPLDTK